MYKGDALADLKAACHKNREAFSSVNVILMAPPQDKSVIEKEISYGISNFLFFSSGEDMAALEDELHRIAQLN